MNRKILLTTVLLVTVFVSSTFFPVRAVIPSEITGSVSVSGSETLDHDVLVTGTLTIESTAVITFVDNTPSPAFKIIVNGTMIINGGAQINFNKDCKIQVNQGGELRVENPASQTKLIPVNYGDPQAYYSGWYGIENNQGEVLINNALIWGACYGVLQSTGGLTDIRNSTIERSGYGIRSNAGTVYLVNNNFTQNSNAVFLTNAASSLIAKNTFTNNTWSVSLVGDNNVDIRCNNFTDGNTTTIELQQGSSNDHVNISFNNFFHFRDDLNYYSPPYTTNYVIDNEGSVVTAYNCYWSNNGETITNINFNPAAPAEKYIIDYLVSPTNVIISAPMNPSIDFGVDNSPPQLVEVSPTKSAPSTPGSPVELAVVISETGWGINPSSVIIKLVKGGTEYTATVTSHLYNDRQYIFFADVELTSVGEYTWNITAEDLAGLGLEDPHNIMGPTGQKLVIATGSSPPRIPYEWKIWNPGNYHLISIPVTPFQQDHKFALGLIRPDTVIARYQNGAYVYYGDQSPVLEQFSPGKGFWVKLGLSDTIAADEVPGDPLEVNKNLTLPNLQPGWHLVGNPFNGETSLNFNRISVNYTPGNSDSDHSYLEAVADGVISYGFWGYSTPLSIYTYERTSLELWKGYWIKINQACDLNFLRNPYTFSQTKIFNWDVQLTASQIQNKDSANYFGLANKAQTGVDGFDAEKPPAIAKTFRSYFLPPNSGRGYGTDYRSASATQERWYYVVTGLVPGSARIAWSDLGSVPKNYRLILKDLKTGVQVDLRQNSSYVFVAGQETRRDFKVIMTDLASVPLQITGLKTAPNPMRARNGTTITYNLSGDAIVEARIYDWRGNQVYAFPAAVKLAGGNPQSFTWNCRNRNGRTVSRGVYILKIMARSAYSQAQVTMKMTVVN